MKKYRVYLVLALGLLMIAAIWLWRCQHTPALLLVAQQEQPPSPISPANGQPTPIFTATPSERALKQKIATGEQAKQEQEKVFLSAFNTPINFWGKVIDQNGNPVEGAEIIFCANDKYWEPGSKYHTKSDQNGLFSITGVKGINLSVGIQKAGYYRNPESYGAISYVTRDPKERPVPTVDNPAIFVLRKMGDTVPLVRVTERTVRVPKSGAPVGVSLATGQTMSSTQGGLTVECWTDDQSKNAQEQYNWHCRLTVPGGGLIECSDQYTFEAPAGGYKSSVELTPSHEKWSARAEQQYYVKLPDDRYARISFKIRTGGEHYFVIESYLNPNPGNRNLEFDPAKAVKKP